MIQHCVFLNLKNDTTLNDVKEVMVELSSLVGRLEGFQDFKFGQNLDFENKSPEFGYGFVANFANRSALQRYANDLQHMTLGGRLVEMCVNGPHGVIVFDLSV